MGKHSISDIQVRKRVINFYNFSQVGPPLHSTTSFRYNLKIIIKVGLQAIEYAVHLGTQTVVARSDRQPIFHHQHKLVAINFTFSNPCQLRKIPLANQTKRNIHERIMQQGQCLLQGSKLEYSRASCAVSTYVIRGSQQCIGDGFYRNLGGANKLQPHLNVNLLHAIQFSSLHPCRTTK